ncbi:MAG: lactonase family protein [Longimicrobiales bacterium]|nr:lactonase family protein [Longimicrobiales bacterium]
MTRFLRIALALVVLVGLASACRPRAEAVFVYVGTSTGDPENGIHVLRFDPEDGSLAAAPLPVAPVPNPSFLALAPDGRTLYAVREVDDGGVAVFRRDPGSGALTALGRGSSGGAGPAHLSVHPTGRWLLVANYGGGTVALLPVGDDGIPGEPVDVVRYEGGGPDPVRQEAPHPHYIRTAPDGRQVLVADLGTDRVIAYPQTGSDTLALDPDRAVVTRTTPGAGPRHLAFAPGGAVAYLVNELHGSVTAWSYDGARGTLDALQTVSTLPDGFAGENYSAAIHVHPAGRWLYVSNRGDFDSIAWFAIDARTGRLELRGHQREGITWPRSFAFHPDGRWLLVANRRAGEVRVFAVDPGTGALTATDERATIPEPTHVLLAPEALRAGP